MLNNNHVPKFTVGQVVIRTDYYLREHATKILRIEGHWNKRGQPPVFVYSLRDVKSTNGYIDLVEDKLRKANQKELKDALYELGRVGNG